VSPPLRADRWQTCSVTERRPGRGRPDDLDRVPDLADAPLDWDPSRRRFSADEGGATSGPATDVRRIVIGAPPEGGSVSPPPRRTREVVLPGAAPAGPAAATAAPAPVAKAAPGRLVVPAPSAAPAASPTPVREARDRPAPPAPASDGPGRTRGGRRRARRIVLGVLLVLLLLVGGGLLWGYQQFRAIERVELADILATDAGTNYLIVGSDTREGVDPNSQDGASFLGPDAPDGQRSDTMLVLRVADDGSRMLSVPRDLYVTIAETGRRSRINSAFNGGPRRLVATIQDQLQLPIHHYVEIDFFSFRDLVDALGGITIEFPYPASDRMSGLDVQQTGPVRLDGDQALAYVRSRQYTETIDGRQVTEPTGDIGRTVRQQQFLSAVVREMGSVRNPIRLAQMTSSMVDGMRIDDAMTYTDAIRLAWRFRSLQLEPTSLPTVNRRTSAGASVLDLVQPGADEVLGRFGSPGAAID